METTENKIENQESTSISFEEFLESSPPSNTKDVTKIIDTERDLRGELNFYIRRPEIQLHCSEVTCNGIRFFRPADKYSQRIKVKEPLLIFLKFICSNCQKTTRTFALSIVLKSENGNGAIYKFGENPPFGPPTSPKLINMIGPYRDIFLKGRRCENQGLGIGAFVYYRRVVETQKNRILTEIIKVAEKYGVTSEKLKLLNVATEEIQFSKSIDIVKDAIPQVLLINGYNPLMLLHTALSKGLHELSDEDCLEIASSIRIVLGELSDRISQALKDEVELKHALNNLNKLNSKS